jgi:hypothetical protein
MWRRDVALLPCLGASMWATSLVERAVLAPNIELSAFWCLDTLLVAAVGVVCSELTKRCQP